MSTFFRLRPLADASATAFQALLLIDPYHMVTVRAAINLAAVPALICAGSQEDAAALAASCGGTGVPSQGERCKARRSDDKAQTKDERDLSKQEDVSADSCLRS
ncbi:MAG: hypothetical protein NTU45_00455 [Planctomycetota bacterium]|nr:hypothetical protein [Planctomycetota bacterium]